MNKNIMPLIIIMIVCGGIIFMKTYDKTSTESVKMQDNLNDYSSYAIDSNLPTFLRGELAGHENQLFLMADKYKVDPYLIGAIMHHETANGTSNMLKTRRNVGGIKPRSGTKLRKISSSDRNPHQSFETIDASIEELCLIISNYHYKYDRHTLDEIGRYYAEDKGWARKVKAHLKAITK